MQIGDKVDYTPRIINTDLTVQNKAIIKYEPRGCIFNQDMAVIEDIDHWVPACELRLNKSS